MAAPRDVSRGRVTGATAEFDVVVVGAGPNGLTAASRLVRAGARVLVVEAAPTVGGGARTAESTEAGYRHDVCAGFHPIGAGSPAFAALGLWDEVELLRAPIEFAHPLDDGRAALVWGDIDKTASALGRDGARWRRLITPHLDRWEGLSEELLAPIVHVPRAPIALARFAILALRPAAAIAARFATGEGAALIPGCAAHAAVPLEQRFTGGLGLGLAVAAHAHGFAVARGGSQAISDALATIVRAGGGVIECGRPITSVSDLPPSRVVLFDTSARQLSLLGAARIPRRTRARLDRFRPGAGVVKVDYAIDEIVPWSNPAVREAAAVHVGGTPFEIAASERAVVEGRQSERPFVLVGQQSVADPSRAPAGKHTLWTYTHVPQGVSLDTAAVAAIVTRIEDQIERFAPGFREVVRSRRVTTPDDYERYNPNMHGGDFAGGALTPRQIVARPSLRSDPYRVRGVPGWYLCSASAAPGPGVHGMSGWNAAGRALARELRA